jgi:hypothetical protein
VLTLLAVAGKLLGGGIGAWGAVRGYPPVRSAAIVGVGMVPRGEVGLIIAGIGRAQGVIPDAIFSALIIMSIATTLLAPPVLKWLYRVWPERTEPEGAMSATQRGFACTETEAVGYSAHGAGAPRMHEPPSPRHAIDLWLRHRLAVRGGLTR